MENSFPCFHLIWTGIEPLTSDVWSHQLDHLIKRCSTDYFVLEMKVGFFKRNLPFCWECYKHFWWNSTHLDFHKIKQIIKRWTNTKLPKKYFSCANILLNVFFLKWSIPGLFSFIFVFSIHSWQQTNVQYINKYLPMTGFEPRTSGIGSDCSTNWATTTAYS